MANEFNEDLDIDVQFNSDLANAKALAFTKNIKNIDRAVRQLNTQMEKLGSNLDRLYSGNLSGNINAKFVIQYGQQINALQEQFERAKQSVERARNSGVIRTLNEEAKVQNRITSQTINEKTLSRELRDLEIAKLKAKTKTNQELLKSQKYTKALVAYEQSRKNLQDQRNQALIDAGLREPAKPKISGDISNLRSAYKDVNEQVRDINKNTKTTNKEVSNWAKRMTRVVASFLSIRTITRVISQVVRESGSWIENLNLFAVTFGESNYREMLDWATELADKLGLSNNEIVKMTGYFKQLSSAIGIAGEQGTELSQILTQLGYDFASFYNIDTASAFEKLQSGIFSGQIRTLRSLGIDVSQAAIQNLLDMNEAFAVLNAQATDLTQMQKVLARTILTMQAGVNAFGDMARSIDTLQNRQRVLTASLENLRLAFGDLLAEPAREFLAYGIAITQVITDIIRSIVPLQTELSYDIGDTVFTEITDEAEEAESAINQLSFDKFNALTTGDDEQVSLTEALNNLLQEQIALYEQVSSQFDGVDERVKEIRDTILQWVFPNKTLEDIQLLLDTSNGMEQFELIMENMNPVLTQIIDGIRSLWTVFQQFLTIVRQVSPELVDILASLFSLLSTIIDILDELNLLRPVLVAIIGLRIANKLKSFGLSFSGITRAITSMTIGLNQARVLQGLTFGERAKATMTNYFNTFKTKTIDGQKVMVQSLNKARVAATALNSVMAAIMAYSIANSFFGQFEREGAIIAGAIGLVVVALMAVAAAAMAAAGAMSWGVAIPIIVGAVAGGVAAIQSIVRGAQEVQGYAIGGIPDKSELFYMNEHGIPEALINTGGTQTNVINQQQLKSLVRDGFIEAMSVNGEQQVNVTISGNDINNSAFARAIFPALKAESKRRGGSQL